MASQYSTASVVDDPQLQYDDDSDHTITQDSYDAELLRVAGLVRTEEMDTAIRWSPLSTASDPQYLFADVVGRSFRLYCASTDGQLDLDHIPLNQIARIDNVPAFRAFDWSPANNLVAVGQWSGETTVLALDTGAQVLSLPIKSQRQCNAVAFGGGSLLATGLERVRNDFCLNVYDINQRSVSSTLQTSGSSTRQTIDPVKKLATSEGITSIKYFLGQPNTLVAGVKATCVRIYDLREDTTNPSLQYQTACVHNLAVDYTDENYFASAGPPRDTTVLVWDRRSTRSPVSTEMVTSTHQDGSVLSLKREGEDSIWRLQFSSAERGCLGILLSSGSFRVYHTKKEYVEEGHSRAMAPEEEFVPTYRQKLRVGHRQSLEHSTPRPRPGTNGQESLNRIVSFDFMNILAPNQPPYVITLRGNGEIRTYKLQSHHPALAVSSLNAVALSRPRTYGPSRGMEEGEGIDSSVMLREAGGSGTITSSVTSIQERVGTVGDDGTAPVARSKAQDGNLVSDGVDFSYLGVHSLWHQDLGQLETRLTKNAPRNVSVSGAMSALAQSLGLQDAGLPPTSKPERRLLGLYTLGFSAKTGRLFSTVNNLAESGDNIQASLLALMFNNSDLALKALQSGPQKNNDTLRGLSMAITAFSLVEEAKLEGERKAVALQRIKEAISDTKDQYAQAIAAYLTAGEWTGVLSLSSLSLRYRVGIALRSLADDALSAYLTEQTTLAIHQGNIQGVVLTGLTLTTLDLFQAYMERTSDLQSAVLAMSFSAPRFVRSPRFDLWRRLYRAQLNTWKLYLERTHFDAQSTKLSTTHDGVITLQAQPAQVTLRCNKCAEALHTDAPPDLSARSVASATSGRHQGGIFGDARSGTVCPKCNAHLPRCVICDMWLGVPDPRSRGALTGSRDAFADALEVCLACNHMYHRGHAEEWFAGHEKCPVPDCECRCNELDTGGR
ncbi:hypothetical protein MMC13_008429 [Lambiella insularis]|nr:hypothetical protein [Lambiella insularis]